MRRFSQFDHNIAFHLGVAAGLVPSPKFRAITLALGDGDAPPTEFRLFTKGWNETENGKFLFDEKAAKSVMAAYRDWGVDLAIDLEHQMLEVAGGAPDPTARDARGWCKLELRADGSLWATDVRWTPDGTARLQQKRQRYISPAFEADPKTKRVLKMINVAITAMPATHNTPALVAASAKGKMDPNLVKQALEAIEKGDMKGAMELLKGMIADAAGAGPDSDADADGSQGDGAEGVAETEAVTSPEVVDNAAAPPPASGGDDDEDDDKPAKKAERKAMRLMLCRLTGKKTMAEAVLEVENYRSSHLTLESERQKLAKERATLESAERRQLVTTLVRLGAEFPSTVWADDKATTIKARWLKMPIAELRSHVAEQRKARGDKTPAGPSVQPAAGGAPEVVALSAEELKICADTGCDPKDFATLKSQRDQGDTGYVVAQRAREANAVAQVAKAGK
jgi:phage I-like protein